MNSYLEVLKRTSLGANFCARLRAVFEIFAVSARFGKLDRFEN